MRLAIETVGRLAIRLDGRELELSNRKPRALIGYLALTDRCEDSRERLVGLLWSESEEDKARASLRQTLHEIRGAFHAVGFDGLRTDKLKIALDGAAISVDIWDMLAAAKSARAHRLLTERERPLESLMADLESVDPAFRAWLFAKRQSLQVRLVRALEEAMRAGSEAAGIEDLARALMSLDPTHEEAARALISARAGQGDIGGALGIYKKLWDLLGDEYDVEPSKETQELISAIKLAQPEGPAPDQPKPSAPGIEVRQQPARARLVVSLGPFGSSGVQDSQRYLIQEFRRELIASLVRFREWLVRDLPVGPVQAVVPASDELVLDGGAYQTDTGVCLVLTLREPSSGSYLWSERLDVSPSQWWTAQQKIVRRIATALNVHISAGRMAHIARRRSDADLLTYDLWLRGQALIMSFDTDSWHKAVQLFHQVIERTPRFGPAYSSLAQLQNIIPIAHYGVTWNAPKGREALGYAREAVRLDPVDSRAQLCLGWANLMSNQHEQALGHYELAIELNDNDPWTLISSALGFAFSGEHERARQLADQALSLSLAPSGAHWGYQARVRYLGGDFDAAAEAARQAADVPAFPGWKAAILQHLGDKAAAAAEIHRLFELSQARWRGAAPWSPEAVMRWFLYAFPIRRKEDWERLRDDLAAAGAPVSGVEHTLTGRDQAHMPTA